ncbi:prepilin-type N-terminal cleavage/methylation domain-containing protein [Paraliomyxa miuraensis]|uniref:prepilin-type N-terminal cleavage/methylation domain-containing protein n=3 Tax=Paraliomyxa miuraensis TaxID=376150 RepID=UPI002253C373|nr:prepilin-type N-terminal cleavage/methylation domain-containing protein [Paraliomyxa miuraensis]MCX4242796.1 prepilin-type N-terminal cleavage/methylation domain-containing protein [Paraliomyxa miuraensis]
MARRAMRARGRAGRVRADRGQAGFTLMEVLVALAVFAISVVGLVALESRSIESQRASRELREGERIAQETMADLYGKGFLQLLSQDFAGNANPSFPYDDQLVAANERQRSMSRPPADIPDDEAVVGEVRGSFLVFRRVDWVTTPGAVPGNPPSVDPLDPDNEIGQVNALELEVVVLWIDHTNPGYPPPEGLQVTDLVPAMTDPQDPEFRPYVGNVRLRTVRVNDVVLVASDDGGTGP